MKTPETIWLVSEPLGEREFEYSHAQRLIRLEHQLGQPHWTPKEKKKFKIENGALIRNTGTGNSESPSE